MQYKELCGCKISQLGFGTMRLPFLNEELDANGKKDRRIHHPKAMELLEYAYAHGVNYYDTAYGYHNGESEVMVGEFLKNHPRESVYIADKFPGYDEKNFARYKEIFAEQLQRLGTDYIDFYLAHCVDESNIDNYCNADIGVMEWLLQQKAAGRIRHLGFSFHGNLETLKCFLERYGKELEFGQLQLNWLDWSLQHADREAELLTQYGLPVWVMEPLRGGKLVNLDETHTAQLRALRADCTPVDWAFRFLQADSRVGVILSGMSTLEQVQDNVRIFETDRPLSDEDRTALIEMGKDLMAEGTVPCTACCYCMEQCPMGLNIPWMLQKYNESQYSKGKYVPTEEMDLLPDGKRPADCLSCGACAAVCPQHIAIPGTIASLNGLLEAARAKAETK